MVGRSSQSRIVGEGCQQKAMGATADIEEDEEAWAGTVFDNWLGAFGFA